MTEPEPGNVEMIRDGTFRERQMRTETKDWDKDQSSGDGVGELRAVGVREWPQGQGQKYALCCPLL